MGHQAFSSFSITAGVVVKVVIGKLEEGSKRGRLMNWRPRGRALIFRFSQRWNFYCNEAELFQCHWVVLAWRCAFLQRKLHLKQNKKLHAWKNQKVTGLDRRRSHCSFASRIKNISRERRHTLKTKKFCRFWKKKTTWFDFQWNFQRKSIQSKFSIECK